MTVGYLKAMLDEYDDDMKIIFQPCYSMYGERIRDIEESNGVVAFNGKNYKALVLTSDGQCGAICSEDDLELEEK